VQAKPTTERELVSLCIAELCQAAGFADDENLVQRDLQFLCDSIESKTGVLISLSTIKRLLNGQFSRLPQIATLDAMAIFLGYQNWHGFKSDKSQKTGTTFRHETSPEESAEPIQPATSPGNRPTTAGSATPAGNRSILARSLFWSIPLLLITIGLLAIMKNAKHRVANSDKAHFSAVKVTGNDIPNTVIFSYNIDSITADSFFIQQSWDKNRRVRIDKHTHTLTDIYYAPGYHTAKLIANDQIIKTAEVSIPTDRWFFYAQKFPGSRPSYISPAKAFKNGSLQLTQDDLISSKIDLQQENQYVLAYYPSNIESSSDNFTLKFRIKVNELDNTSCPNFMCEIFCQQNFMYFKNTVGGCVSELDNQFGENYLSGKTHDFSAMGVDLKAWQNVELTVKNKKASIKINNMEVFSTIYEQSCGLITGLGFISNGLCEVDAVDLKTIDGKNIYSNNFDH